MMQIHSYIDQLEELSLEVGLPLKRAFILAGVPDSTFYRVMHGQDLRLDTAQKIALAIEKWSPVNGLAQHKEHSHTTSYA